MKTIKILLLLSIWIFPNYLNAQIEEDIEIIRLVADNIRENTTFKIVNTETNELYSSSENLPVAENYRIHSPYNAWKYWNGVLTVAMIRTGEIINDKKYIDYAVKNIDFIFDQLPYFEKQYDKGVIGNDMHQHFRLKMLDDCGAMAAGISDVYQRDPKNEYMDYLNKAANYVMNEEYRLEDGTFARTRPDSLTVWSDDLYMSIPFLVRMGNLTGEHKYYDEATKQVMLFYKHLYSPQTGLYYHCWFDDIKKNGVAHWGRGYTWTLMAETELLAHLPEDHILRDSVISLLRQKIEWIARYQSESGLWHQLINKTDSYLETSSTAMITYTIARAINEGWLDERYASVAENGWEGLKTRVRADGQVEGICRGTSISNNLVDYYKRPTPLNDIHGLGPFILAGSEIIRLKQE